MDGKQSGGSENLEKIQQRLTEIADQVEDGLRQIEEGKEIKINKEQLEKLHTHVLGRKGELTSLLRMMGGLAPEDRPALGALINEARSRIEARMDVVRSLLEQRALEQRWKVENIDVTAPGVAPVIGKRHPITQVHRELRDIFIGMGFVVEEGPEIEWSKYNFDMLNFNANHPARDSQDTFYINDDMVLRTHTSPVQVRTMLQQKPPIRMICPGRVFRSDDVDATHSPVFNQLEGLVVDKDITMGDLMGVLTVFLQEFYGADTKVRFRPSYFPFTEPSMEVDISCTMCGGEGCRVCKGSGWIELLGSGMVHPNVLRAAGVDPEEYSGFAFGFGLDRIVNMKYGITDIRLLYENDIRFLEQF